eukprot:8948260-Pyramimonas_sp.AAC.1
MRFSSEAPISNHALFKYHRLGMLLIIEGDRWRARSKERIYHAGWCWDQVEVFDIKGWEYLAAPED